MQRWRRRKKKIRNDPKAIRKPLEDSLNWFKTDLNRTKRKTVIKRLMERSIERSIECWIERLIIFFIKHSIGCSIERLIKHLIERSIKRSIERSNVGSKVENPIMMCTRGLIGNVDKRYSIERWIRIVRSNIRLKIDANFFQLASKLFCDIK